MADKEKSPVTTKKAKTVRTLKEKPKEALPEVPEKEEAAEKGKEIITALKQTDEIFRNVRLNAVRWISDETITRGVTAAPILQMGRYFEDYEQHSADKRLEVLMDYLKKFDARSRLLILVTEGKYRVEDAEALKKSLNPFLYRKILLMEPGGIKTGRQLL